MLQQMYFKRLSCSLARHARRRFSTQQAVVPTLDLQKFTHGSVSDREEFVEELRTVGHGIGFFYLKHGIPQEDIDKVESLVQSAFDLSEEEKRKIDKKFSPQFRGWEGTLSEYTGGKPDFREQIDTWSECTQVSNENGKPKYTNLLGPNQYFPDDVLPGYREITQDWHNKFSSVSMNMLKAFSLAIGMHENALDERFGEIGQRQSLMKYIHYPGASDGSQGVGMHQDSMFLTLVMPGKTSGLEVQLDSGEMLPVHRKDGHFVINIGEALQMLSGNYFVATPHRVMTKERRYSVAFFYGPTLDSVLTPSLDIPNVYRQAVENSPKHRSAGMMPTKKELNEGKTGSYDGESKHATYGDMLWAYFSRSHPEAFAYQYPAEICY